MNRPDTAVILERKKQLHWTLRFLGGSWQAVQDITGNTFEASSQQTKRILDQRLRSRSNELLAPGFYKALLEGNFSHKEFPFQHFNMIKREPNPPVGDLNLNHFCNFYHGVLNSFQNMPQVTHALITMRNVYRAAFTPHNLDEIVEEEIVISDKPLELHEPISIEEI